MVFKDTMQKTLAALDDDKNRKDMHKSFARATERLHICRCLAGNSLGTTSRHVIEKRSKRFDIKPDEEENRFLSHILNNVPLMVMSSQVLGKMREALFGKGDEMAQDKGSVHEEPGALLSMVVGCLHKIKTGTARVCWDEISPLKEELSTLQEKYNRVLETKTLMQIDYLREITQLRDALRRRGDPEEEAGLVRDDADIVMYYEPIKHMEPNSQTCVLEVVREKLKMIFDKRPGLESTVNTGQLTAMKALVESNQVTEMKKTLARKVKECHELTSQVVRLEKDFKRLKNGPDALPGCSPEAFMAMDNEINAARLEIARLKKQLEDEHSRISRQSQRASVANDKVLLLESQCCVLDSDLHNARSDLEKVTVDLDKLRNQHQRTEALLKQSQADVSRLKQSEIRAKKVQKAEEGLPGGAKEQAKAESPHTLGPGARAVDFQERPVDSTALIHAAQQSEKELKAAREEASNLRKQNLDLEDENSQLRELGQGLLCELTASSADAAQEVMEATAQYSSDLESLAVMELDVDDEKIDTEASEESGVLKEEMAKTESRIESITKELDQSSNAPMPDIEKTRDLQMELSKLQKQSAQLKVRLVLAEFSAAKKDQAMRDIQEEMAKTDSRIGSIMKELNESSKVPMPDLAKTMDLQKELVTLQRQSAQLKLRLVLAEFAAAKRDQAVHNAEVVSGDRDRELKTLRVTLKMYRVHVAALTKQLRSSLLENQELNAKIDKMQSQMHKLIGHAQSLKGAKNSTEIQRLFKEIIVGVQKDNVFDRLYLDASRRQSKIQAEQIERQRRLENCLEKTPLLLVKRPVNDTRPQGESVIEVPQFITSLSTAGKVELPSLTMASSRNVPVPNCRDATELLSPTPVCALQLPPLQEPRTASTNDLKSKNNSGNSATSHTTMTNDLKPTSNHGKSVPSKLELKPSHHPIQTNNSSLHSPTLVDSKGRLSPIDDRSRLTPSDGHGGKSIEMIGGVAGHHLTLKEKPLSRPSSRQSNVSMGSGHGKGSVVGDSHDQYSIID